MYTLGMENERIVASGIHYWHSENITESNLTFRAKVCEPDYEQDDHRGVNQVYGINTDEPLIQEMGSVVCVQGIQYIYMYEVYTKMICFI